MRFGWICEGEVGARHVLAHPTVACWCLESVRSKGIKCETVACSCGDSTGGR
ncbi:hypothetical protein T484DRAFT_1963868 [Baffinella frigidus]|nr:hypothetical protein T484DRAFT_1963867 [Cryptophyta sp. CCMP2293]KAJ1477144.1 hypothetical protein T484DRAFT_1963868 [Cryptophyta sp. CCMP2293]